MKRILASAQATRKLAEPPASHMPLPIDAVEALRKACDEYPGGVPAVAAKLGMKAGVLYNKLSGDEDLHHKPTIQDFLRIYHVTSDLRPLQALARAMNCVTFQVPDFTKLSDSALLDLISKMHEEEGEYHGILRVALEDGKIDNNEALDLDRQMFRWLGAIVEAHSRVMGLRHGAG